MKNRWTWIIVIMAALALVGCNREKTGKIENVSDLKGKVIGTVMPVVPITKMEMSIANAIGAQPKEVKYFNRYSDCVTAVLSGKVDAVLSPKFGAEYYVKKNTHLKMISREPVRVNVVMMLRSEDRSLKDNLDKAITTLRGNGTLKRLEDEWVTNLPADKDPISLGFPKIEGAKTIYVGVCGDYIPLDYIAANGRPAGYNVALLTEVGKLLNINFEFVSIETQARFAALSSKKIDLIFCNLQANTPALLALKSNSWAATKPYFTSEAGCFLVKK
jgi:ABC-type amino acid transport substrate-binding protein